MITGFDEREGWQVNVFILGIMGGTGSRIAKLLLQRGHSVSGLCRHPKQAPSLEAMGARPLIGDIANLTEQELSRLLSGTRAVVFAAGAGDQDKESMIDAVDYGGVRKTVAAMRLAGLSRLLVISVFPEAAREQCLGASFEHYISAKKKAEVEVVNSGFDWIILRPSSLKNDPGIGRVSLSLANFHTEITRDDLAATAVALLESSAITKKILEVTEGDQPIASAVSALLTI
jgi:uncharacterized protein YbjT (DUF2867 family)